jgi:ribose/xylose/arabinose/galactoside ABC-type transport system permease subunit
MGDIAKILIFLGAVLIAAGLVLLLFQKTPFPGRLPGDIVIKRENFTFYFPLATSIIISIVISLILYLVGKFK